MLTGEAAEAQRASLETSACRRLKGLAGVLGSGVACTLKGPPCDHIARLLVTTYRLLKAVTIHYKAPQSETPSLPLSPPLLSLPSLILPLPSVMFCPC